MARNNITPIAKRFVQKKAGLLPGFDVVLIVASDRSLGNGGLFIQWAINQLNHCHRRGVAWTRSEFQDSDVAARALFEARTEILEQFPNHFLVAQATERKPAIRNAIFFSKGNQRFDDPSKLLSLRDSCLDRFMTQ